MKTLKNQFMDFRSYLILADRPEDRSLPSPIFTQALTFLFLLLAGTLSASENPISLDPVQFASPVIHFKPRPLWFWNNTAVNE